jgi:hypothetical protein
LFTLSNHPHLPLTTSILSLPLTTTKMPSNSAEPSTAYVATADPKKATASQPPPAAPPGDFLGSVPNGGLQAWLQVVAGFALFFNTFGILNTFGVFQTYYESGVLIHASSSNIS